MWMLDSQNIIWMIQLETHLIGSSAGTYDAPSASQPEDLKPESAEVAHGNQYRFPSANTGYALDDAQSLNAAFNETSSQVQNLAQFSNVMQVHDKQYQQSQELAYQAQQLAYQQQHASQEQQQQLLWQQYQQYQGYQLLQQQQQSKEGSSVNMQGHHMHQHPSQRQQDEELQQRHQYAHSKQNFTQQMSQNQQGSKRATPDYDVASPSQSPSLGVQSPQALQ